MSGPDPKPRPPAIDPKAAKALAELARVDPVAAAGAADFMARRSGAFAHLNTPLARRSLAEWALRPSR
jgi:hypothetical protein